MPTGESSRVLEAVNVLCNASGDLLRPHWTKLLAAVEKHQSRIEGHSTAIVPATGRHTPHPTTDDRSPTPSSVSHHSSSNRLGSNGSISLSPNGEDPLALSRDQHASPQPPLSSIEKFMRGLENGLKSIKTFYSHECREIITSEPEWAADDPRIVDIQIAGGSKPSNIINVRRGLSQRSLALEYRDWESSTYGISSVEQRANDLSAPLSRKLGHITEFLGANMHRFYNSAAARDGIEHGIKLLVCEELLGGIGISAILFFRFSSLRSLKYEELKGLKNAIEEQDLTEEQDSNSIKKLAGQKADWLRQCQSKYDACCKKVTRQSTKRRCLSGSSSQHKRTKPGRSHSELRRPLISRQLEASNSSRRPVSKPNSKKSNTNNNVLSTVARAEDLTTGINNQTISTRTSSTATTSPPQQTQYEQDRQSSASRIPSSQLLTQTNPPQSFGHSVSSGGCDGTNTSSTTGIAMDGTARQSSSQLEIPPFLREGERYLQSTNVSAVRLYDLGSGAGPTANAGSYIHWYPPTDNTPQAEAPGLNYGARPTADADSYITWFSAEAPVLNYGARPTADADSYITWFSPDACGLNYGARPTADAGSYIPGVSAMDNTLEAEAPGLNYGAGNYVRGLETNI